MHDDFLVGYSCGGISMIFGTTYVGSMTSNFFVMRYFLRNYEVQSTIKKIVMISISVFVALLVSTLLGAITVSALFIPPVMYYNLPLRQTLMPLAIIGAVFGALFSLISSIVIFMEETRHLRNVNAGDNDQMMVLQV